MFYAPLGNIRICEYNPPSPWWRHIPGNDHSKKCPGDLNTFPDLDLGGNFRICEYTPSFWWRHIREFLDVVNMKEYVEYIWRNMSKIWKSMKKYVNILDLALPYIRALGLGKIPHPSFLLGPGTWKNFDLHPYIYIGLYEDRLWTLPLYRLLDLKKCWAYPSFDYSLLARCHSFVFSI